jgi:acetyl/propionyl-CoA carboxylase alpha subunit/acetyl-CoA carboxylase carboxyltransferase component
MEQSGGGHSVEHPFKRIAIVDRGEPAMRLVRAARELNREQHTELRTVALFTEPDRRALFVREADDAVCIGPASFVDQQDGWHKSAYLDRERIEQALIAAKADAAWVGWGLLAEESWLADLCQQLGIVFIGPDARVLQLFNNQVEAKQLAQRAEVPVIPWSDGPVETVDEARQHAERIGYPLVVKSAIGTGGLGIRTILSSSELENVFQSARDEAQGLFGDPTVFIERLVEGVRHIVVQTITDAYETTWIVGIRDCTVQNRNQKILQEAPPSILPPEQELELREAAIRLCKTAGYQNVATIEFLYDSNQRKFWLLDVKPRLGIDHPVTEVITGLDLVKLQLGVARGSRLQGEPPIFTGYAVSVRLSAEDPDNRLAPSPGKLDLFQLASGPGLRIDTGFKEGDNIPSEFNPMIAEIIAWGRSRQEALARLGRALAESEVVVRGGMSNKAFLLDLLSRPEIDSNQVDIQWLERLVEEEQHRPRQYADVALLQAAIEAYDAELLVEQAQFYAGAARGRPKARSGTAVSTDFRSLGQGYRLNVSRLGAERYRVAVDGRKIDVSVERLVRFERRVTCFGRHYKVLSVVDGPNYSVEVNGILHRLTHEEGGLVRTPASAVVVSVSVSPGDRVEVGDRLAVIEVMKMEMAITASFSGRVTRVLVKSNVHVEAGAPLVQLEPLTRTKGPTGTERAQFDGTGRTTAPSENDPQTYSRNMLEALRCQVLGYDYDAADAKQLLSEQSAVYRVIAPGEADLLRGEDEILSIFADISLLFRRESDPIEAAEQGEQVHSAEQDLLTYLRQRDIRMERLPAAFLDKLRRALAHYDVESLDPSPELDESLLAIYTSHQRVNQQIAAVGAILERRLLHIDKLASLANEDLRALLDRLLLATQGRYPTVNDLVREVRYRYFDQPFFEQARKTVYDEMQAHLAYLAEHPDAADRSERMSALVDCPQPIQTLLTSRYPQSDEETRKLMLEAITRRYYRIRRLEDFECVTVDGQNFAKATYNFEGVPICVVTMFAEYANLSTAFAAIARFVTRFPVEYDIVVDFYVWRSEPGDDAETMEREVYAVLDQAGFSRRIRRIVVAVTGPGHGLGMASTKHFTYRQVENGYREERLYRGLHLMMGKRLNVWRLEKFNIERLPSAEDVYLFHGIAKDNPKDERLFALAEVRDMTPVRDESGKVVQLPHLERMLLEALAGIRLYQSHLPAHRRLFWNRVLLYVWPPLGLQPEELHEIMQKLWPATEGLGLEKITMHAKIADPWTDALHERVLHVSNQGGREVILRVDAPDNEPIETLTEYRQKVVQMRQRGLIYPYEQIEMLTPAARGTRTQMPPGEFEEYDLDENNHLVPVKRPYGKNKAGMVVGVIRNYTTKYPEGMTRVILLGDPSKNFGSIAEPEARRVIEAVNLAEQLQVPIDWFPLSAGAKISMDSGTENMDWVSRALKRIALFTLAGGEINVVVNGINVGGQPYWNAASTVLMQTRGILVMTSEGAMVLTGKQSLDYSGGVSAEDNYGIGGYEIMGPNGEAQYFAHDLSTAMQILMRHYNHAYVMPGERFPRRAKTNDPATRDVRDYPYSSTRPEDHDLIRVGDIFSDEKNPGRKRAFDMRTVMSAIIDADHRPLERWTDMRDAENVIVWDAHIGGYPVAMIGIESRPIPRHGFIPADGPEQWTAGTLFPMAAKKAARTINSVSGNRPLVVVANLTGFDSSPESMRNMELEYGAEIGRAVASFKGPIVLCAISRIHGGSFVVFSKVLNENIEIAAVEGSYASVIGGVPAAAVVFARDVDIRTKADPRVKSLQEQLAKADGAQKAALQAQLNEVTAVVRSEKVGEIANEFDNIHSVERATRIGSIDYVIPAFTIRPYIIEALGRGIERERRRIANQEEASRQPWSL